MSLAEQVTAYIRRCGPMTGIEAAMGLGWCNNKALGAIRDARHRDLLKRIGKRESGTFVFAAVQTTDWPTREGIAA